MVAALKYRLLLHFCPCRRFSAMGRTKSQGSTKKGVKSIAFKMQQTEKAARKAAKELHDRLKEAKEQEKKVGRVE